jgi:multidrug resistance protein MdtO
MPKAVLIEDLFARRQGRAAQAGRIAAACALVTILSMALGVPEVSLSCYLIFFASKEGQAETVMTAVKLIAAATVGAALGFVFIMLTAGEPMLRILAMAFFMMGGLYLAAASRLGAEAATAAFVFSFVLTLFDLVPVPELITRAVLWLWVVTALPMGVLIVLNLVAGERSTALVSRTIATRLRTAARLLAGEEGARAGALGLLAEGNDECFKRVRLGALLEPLSAELKTRLNAEIAASYRVLALSLASRPAGDPGLAARLVALADQPPRDRLGACEKAGDAGGGADAAASFPRRQVSIPPVAATYSGHPPPAPARAEDGLTRAVRDLIDGLASSHERPQPPLLVPDVKTNPAYIRFALKTSLAAAICYLFYTGLSWPGIHTAFITCFFVALGTTGETVHKMTLRIAGCVIGGAAALASAIWLMPHLVDVGQLALLVGAFSFVAAWVSGGGPRVYYAGWQMALCFFLCVLHSDAPSFDLVVIRDRTLGILFANLVLGVIFLEIWPVSVKDASERALRQSSARLRDIIGRAQAVATEQMEEVFRLIGEERRLASLNRFEPRRWYDQEDIEEAALCAGTHFRLAGEILAAYEEQPGSKDGGPAASAQIDRWLNALSLPTIPAGDLAGVEPAGRSFAREGAGGR